MRREGISPPLPGALTSQQRRRLNRRSRRSLGVQVVELRGSEPLTVSDGRGRSTLRPFSVSLDPTRSI